MPNRMQNQHKTNTFLTHTPRGGDPYSAPGPIETITTQNWQNAKNRGVGLRLYQTDCKRVSNHLRTFGYKLRLAERGGFEPPERFNPFNGLANRRFRPLSHLSCPGGIFYRRKMSPGQVECPCTHRRARIVRSTNSSNLRPRGYDLRDNI